MDIKVNELESTRKKDNDKNKEKDDGKRKARSYSKGSKEKDEYHE